MSEDLHLERHAGVFEGRYGGAVMGKDVHLRVVLEPTSSRLEMWLEGRIGAEVMGKDVTLEGDSPPELAALMAVVAYKLLEDAESASSAGSS